MNCTNGDGGADFWTEVTEKIELEREVLSHFCTSGQSLPEVALIVGFGKLQKLLDTASPIPTS